VNFSKGDHKLKVLKWLDKHFEQTLMGIFLVIMTIVLSVQIIMRFIFSNSLTWAEELSCILLVWSGFLSISYTIRRNSAMRLTMVASMVSLRIRNALLLCAQIVMICFFGIMTVQAVALVQNTQQSTPALGMPMVYLYGMLIVGFALSTLRSLQTIIRIVRNFNTADELAWLPEEDVKEEASC
jgi:C4-dicarboxylate transporter DctQ subunit